MQDKDQKLIWENYTDRQQQHIQRAQKGSQLAQDQGIDQQMPWFYDETKGGPWDNLRATRKALFIQYGENMKQWYKGREYDQLDPTEQAAIDQYNAMLEKEYQKNQTRMQNYA